MNKLRFVPIVALLLGLLSATALAVETPTELPPTAVGGKTYTVTYDATAANSGKQYVILILKKGATPAALDFNSILYIDQAVAGADGKVKFENFQMMRNTSAEVYIGGETLASPAHPHTITVPGVSVSGKVAFISGLVGRLADVKLTDGGSNVLMAKTDAAGLFSFDTVPDGSYTLIATAESHLSYTKRNVVVNGTEITNLNGSLFAGGLNDSAEINAVDLSVLLTDYNKTRANAKFPAADVNDNNDINTADLSILLTNYNKTAITE